MLKKWIFAPILLTKITILGIKILTENLNFRVISQHLELKIQPKVSHLRLKKCWKSSYTTLKKSERFHNPQNCQKRIIVATAKLSKLLTENFVF